MIDAIRSEDPIRSKIEALGTTLSLPTVRKALGILEGAHASDKRFGADDVMDIRIYEPGDEAKRIDWKTSARVGRPMVVQRERPSTSRAWLLLDVGQEMTGTCVSLRNSNRRWTMRCSVIGTNLAISTLCWSTPVAFATGMRWW